MAMKMRELDRGSVLKSHTFVPSEDDPVGPIGDFPRRVPRSLLADTEAVIYRPAKSAMTSGRAGLRRWILEFKPRSPPFIEPLMGWTGGTDPLPHMRLSFPSREAAIAYAWRQGLRFTVCEPHEQRPAARSYADNFPAKPADPILLAAWDRPHLVTPNLDDALVDPSRVFDGPREVAEHPLLTEHEKCEVLGHWLWDALLIETGSRQGNAGRRRTVTARRGARCSCRARRSGRAATSRRRFRTATARARADQCLASVAFQFTHQL
jgi:hypothetical protein